jgi:hypothetical protein
MQLLATVVQGLLQHIKKTSFPFIPCKNIHLFIYSFTFGSFNRNVEGLEYTIQNGRQAKK